MARLLIILGLTTVLFGCRGSFEVPPQPTIVAAPIDDRPKAVCLVRARLFKGLVGVSCSDLAQEFRP
jgi:hypothetical protein